jgi:hypothetical protein
MKYILIVLLLLLTGCSVLQDKMDALDYQSCQPVHSMCEQNESLLICDSEDKRDCHGWLIE